MPAELGRRRYLSGLAVGLCGTVAGCLSAPEGDAVSIEEDSQVATRFTNEAGRDASQISTWRDYRSFWVDALSQTSSVQEEQPDAINQIFQESLENIPEGMHAVLFLDRETTEVVGTTDPSFEGMMLDDGDVPWIPDGLTFEDETTVNVSEPYRDGDEPVLGFLTQVRERSEYALAAIARTQAILASKDGGRFSTVVDGSGTIIIDQRDAEFVGQQYGEGQAETAIEQGAAGESGIVNTVPIADELDGEYVAAFAPVDGTEWTVILHAPVETVVEQSTENSDGD